MTVTVMFQGEPRLNKAAAPAPYLGDVRETGDRNVVEVASGSGQGWHRVDLEANRGFGSCTCPRFVDYGRGTWAEAALEVGRFPPESLACRHIRRARTWAYYRWINGETAQA